MPKVSDAHRSARRDEILDAAQRVFARHGYRGSSVAAIVTESGLSAGAIYGYFTCKQELFRAVVERVLDDRTSEIAVRPGGRPRSPGELVRALLEGMRGQPILSLAPQMWGEAAIDEEIGTVVADVFGRAGHAIETELEAWAREEPGRVDEDPARWATRVQPIVLAGVQGFIMQRAILPDFDEDAYLAALTDAYRA